jgi:cytochrome P450
LSAGAVTDGALGRLGEGDGRRRAADGVEQVDLERGLDVGTLLGGGLAGAAGSDFTSEAALRAYGEMEQHRRGLVAERRKHPGADLISTLLHAHVAGEPLSDAEIGGFCSLLHDASQNTTMNTIAHAILLLAREPDARRALAREPARWPRALDELLRHLAGAGPGAGHHASRDAAGVTIGAGDQVLLPHGSANHDETRLRTA